MTVVAIDRSNSTLGDRLTSGVLGAAVVAAAAVVATELAMGSDLEMKYRLIFAWLFASFSFVFGLLLPKKIRLRLERSGLSLPTQIRELKMAVAEYFDSTHQFSEWLNSYNEKLDGDRPLDVLRMEEDGTARLVTLVVNTRAKRSSRQY